MPQSAYLYESAIQLKLQVQANYYKNFSLRSLKLVPRVYQRLIFVLMARLRVKNVYEVGSKV